MDLLAPDSPADWLPGALIIPVECAQGGLFLEDGAGGKAVPRQNMQEDWLLHRWNLDVM